MIREVKAEKVKSICSSENSRFFFLIFHVWTRHVVVIVVVSTNAERKHVQGAARALAQKQAQARTVRDTLKHTHRHTYGTQTYANADTIHVDDVACIGFCLARPKPKSKHARTCSTSRCRCPASPLTSCLG